MPETLSSAVKRPTRGDEDVCEAAAKKLLPFFVAWLDRKTPKEEDDTEDLEALKRVLINNWDHDGFKLAKSLEDDEGYYDADSELVSIMDRASHQIYCALDAKTKKWVKDNNITLPLKVGDPVTWKNGWEGVKSGKISGLRPQTAEYTIHEDGRDYRGSTPEHPLGWIVAAEEVQLKEVADAGNAVAAQDGQGNPDRSPKSD